jgi:hypothetical protein
MHLVRKFYSKCSPDKHLLRSGQAWELLKRKEITAVRISRILLIQTSCSPQTSAEESMYGGLLCAERAPETPQGLRLTGIVANPFFGLGIVDQPDIKPSIVGETARPTATHAKRYGEDRSRA